MPQIAVSSVIMFLLDTIKLNDWNIIIKASKTTEHKIYAIYNKAPN